MKKFFRFLYKKICRIVCGRRISKHGKQLRINRWCKFNKNVYLGDNCNFNGLRISGDGKVTIGNNFHSGQDCLFITSNHNYDSGKAIPYDETYITKEIIIGDNVWIGDRTIILGGSILEEGVIIQAGSVVCGRIEKCSIAGGHPAKVFKKRDEKHYYQLKEEGKFQ